MNCLLVHSWQGEAVCLHAPASMARVNVASPANEATLNAWRKAGGVAYVLERAPSRCPACKAPYGEDEETTAPGFVAPAAPIPSAKVLEDTQP